MSRDTNIIFQRAQVFYDEGPEQATDILIAALRAYVGHALDKGLAQHHLVGTVAMIPDKWYGTSPLDPDDMD
jgi:hypothetical protein